jgi:uncharacterized protein YdcH (DUF465 family)
MIQELKAENNRLFKEFESLPDDITDEEYTRAQQILMVKLDELIDKEDKIRLSNPK